MIPSACPFVNKFTNVLLQQAASYLSPKDFLHLRVVCTKSLVLDDEKVFQQPRVFEPLSSLFLRRLACFASPKLMLFKLPAGTNERMVNLRYSSERINLIQAQAEKALLIIFKDKKEVGRLDDILWVGQTSRVALAWDKTNKGIIPIDLETGDQGFLLKIDLPKTEQFLKLTEAQANDIRSRSAEVFHEQAKFYLLEDFQLYVVYSVHNVQLAAYFRVNREKIFFHQSTSLSFKERTRFSLCEERGKERRSVLYIGEELALTFDNGIVVKKIKPTRSQNSSDASSTALCNPHFYDKKRLLTVLSLTESGVRNHWTRELSELPKKRTSQHEIHDENFVVVVATHGEGSCIYDVFEKRTGARIDIKFPANIKSLFSVSLNKGHLSVYDEDMKLTIWDLNSGICKPIGELEHATLQEALRVCYSKNPVAVLSREIQVLSTHLAKGVDGVVGQLAYYQPEKPVKPVKVVKLQKAEKPAQQASNSSSSSSGSGRGPGGEPSAKWRRVMRSD